VDVLEKGQVQLGAIEKTHACKAKRGALVHVQAERDLKRPLGGHIQSDMNSMHIARSIGSG
jgi:hypothetical protein